MTAQTHCRLTKVALLNGDPTLFQPSYWSQGHLAEDIVVGQPIRMVRYLRGPQVEGEPAEVALLGEFTSSPVAALAGDLIHTRNSVWRLTLIS